LIEKKHNHPGSNIRERTIKKGLVEVKVTVFINMMHPFHHRSG